MSTVLNNVASPAPASRPCAISPRLTQILARVEQSDSLSSLAAIIDQAVISGTTFLTAVVIGRFCGADTLGLYALATSLTAMLLGIQEQLITAPYVMYHGRRSKHSLTRYRSSLLVHQILFIAVGLITTAGVLLWNHHAGKPASPIVVTLLCVLPAILMRGFIREMTLAHCRVTHVLMIDAAVCGTQLLTLGAMLLTGSISLVTFYSMTGLGCLVAVAVWLRTNHSPDGFSVRAAVVHWIRNWRFGRWALATHLAGTSTPYIMPWVLYVMHGSSAAGYLASCSAIVGIANMLLSGMSDFLTPRAAAAYAADGISGLHRVLRRMAILSSVAIGSVCAFSLCYGEQFIAMLYDGRFSGAGTLVVLLTFGVLANALGNVAGNGLWAIDQPRANFTADLIALTTAISGALIFVGPGGAQGAAAAVLLASVMGAASRIAIFSAAASKRTARAL